MRQNCSVVTRTSPTSLALLVMISAILSCSSPSSHAKVSAEGWPKWVHGEPPAQYSRNLFVTGVGSGKSLEEAKGNAKRQLAEVFDAQISGQFASQSQSNQSSSTSGKVEGVDQNQSQSQVVVKTEVQLSSVEIAESYFDSDNKEYFALAVLDKLKLKNKVNQEATQIRARMAELRGRFGTSKKPSDGRRALDLIPEYEKMNQSYTVISGGNRLPPLLTPAEEEEMRRELKALALSRKLWIEWGGASPGDGDLKDALIQALVDRGLSIEAEDRSQAQSVLKIQFTQKPVEMKVEGWVKVEYALKGNLILDQKQNGTVRSTKESTGRTVEMSLKKIQGELLSEFASGVVKSLEDL